MIGRHVLIDEVVQTRSSWSSILIVGVKVEAGFLVLYVARQELDDDVFVNSLIYVITSWWTILVLQSQRENV